MTGYFGDTKPEGVEYTARRWRCLECLAGSSNMPGVKLQKPEGDCADRANLCPNCGSAMVMNWGRWDNIPLAGTVDDRIGLLEDRVKELEEDVKIGIATSKLSGDPSGRE